MNLKRFIGKCRKGLDVINLNAKPSYSQMGEDMIIDYLFKSVNIKNPTYLEIGTNEPLLSNNTYLLYANGSRGVCVEPDELLYKKIVSKRPGDKVLNIGIGLGDMSSGTFYSFPGRLSGWSTFSKDEAVIRQKESGVKFKEIIIQLKTINDIIKEYFNPYPNLISIDVEGLDFDILKSLDFECFPSEVICVETIRFTDVTTAGKAQDILDFVHSKGYFTYADTYPNTIFCRKELFIN